MAKRMNKENNLKKLVGSEVYDVWVNMIKILVPNARTHRISVIVAGMLHYALDQSYLKEHKDNSLTHILQESYDNNEADEELFNAIKLIFNKAKVKYTRKNSKGDQYCIIENSLNQFFHWESMPWE
ncbi:hypothetical protein [Silvanigrella aquatica]|uniref:Uncharacterized protein n=1 Tax=Silvanigrella aquatica TaxID=1915309 RepID=A0A1L4CXX7_9BACT|nr:hypothetical protein [Silvanigrella aquatica]APJ02797.1 hypothetical protein AXG55_02195 [Silvanigrella aquatica]